jgi:signal transduction histidine kinase
MVRSIVSSLISNAFKFTREGKIDVKVKIEQKEKEEYAKIIVSDTGIGIPKDKIDLIWKEFYQVSQGVSREFEGQGLGLTIAKKFTEILGGNISVASELNRGSTFVVELPVRFNSNK